MTTQAIDLSAILAHQPYHQPFQQPQYAPQQVQQQPQAGVAAGEKPKKKAPTADQKREKAVLDILDHKDPFGLIYTGLLLQLDQPSLEAFVAYVKAKHNRA